MSKLVADIAMSLDGFVAEPDDRVDRLHGWFFGGDVEVPTPAPGFSFKVGAGTVPVLTEAIRSVGAILGGRRYFDLAGGWGGRHPMGVPAFIVTHSVPDGYEQSSEVFTFVLDGLESAVEQAKAAAGPDRIVGVASPNVIQQCLDAGLIDALSINLVPIVLGAGVPLFDSLRGTPFEFESPQVAIGDGVTHLRYDVKR